MKKFIAKNKKAGGFTFIEIIVAIAIFSMISMTLFDLFAVVLKNIRNNKAILTSNSLALEQLEIVRGMDFNNVKTDTGWIPTAGVTPIPSERTLLRGGIGYTVKTDISWVDDPFDGTDGAGDTFPYDYKKVRVRVSWTNPVGGAAGEIAMSTSVVPPGLEGMSAGKGGLYLTVFDSGGHAVPSADIDVRSASTGYVLTSATGGRTDLNGNLWIPELTPASDYHISTTKANFSVSETYAVDNDPASPNYNPTPEKINATVINQRAVKMGFQIDTLGSLNIKTVHFQNPANWRVNADAAGEQTDSAAALGLDGKLYVAWADTRDTVSHIYLQKLSAGGGVYAKEWSPDVKLDNVVAPANATAPKLAVLPDGALYALWSDDRSGDSDVYLRKISTASGSAVGSEYLVGNGAVGTAQRNPDFVSDQSGNLYITWEDNRGGSWDIYAQKFVPATGSFWGSDVKVNAQDINEQLNARIIADRDATDNNFYVVWQSNASGNFDILLGKFDKDGAPIFAEKLINRDGGTSDQYDPGITFDGSNNFYIAWTDDRNSQPDIYLQKVDKGGNYVLAADTKINDDSYATARRVKPSIAYASDTSIYVSWEDDRNGNTTSNIYSSKIDSAAARQWTYDLIVADTFGSMQTNAFTLCDAAGKAVTIWQDNRTGDSDIYGSTYIDMGNFTLPNIPITVISEKAKGTYSDPPIPIPKYTRSFTSDGSGNISVNAALGGLEWGSYNFTAGGGYHIVSIDLPSPIYVAPGGTSSVVINVSN